MANIKLIDTHCHLYSYKNLMEVIEPIVQRSDEVGVDSIFMPNVDDESIQDMIALEQKYGHCHAMMGLHPCSVKENYRDLLSLIDSWFEKRKFSGVGETGIDLYWDKTYFDEQVISFNYQIDIAINANLPVIIHSRECQDITIDLITKKQNGNLRGIFHCFSGSTEQAKQIIDLGFYMGIGGVVTYKKTDLPDVLKAIGLSNVVLETDSPYLAPVPHRGKENEPSYLIHIASKIADALDITIEEVAQITTTNSQKIFNIEAS